MEDSLFKQIVATGRNRKTTDVLRNMSDEEGADYLASLGSPEASEPQTEEPAPRRKKRSEKTFDRKVE